MREISLKQAKKKVLDYYLEHGTVYPSDVAQELHLDALIVRELCFELIEEGLLESNG